MPVAPRDLVDAAYRGLAEQREDREDVLDEFAQLGVLVDAAHRLGEVLDSVVGDDTFWKELEKEAGGLGIHGADPQAQLFEELTADQLPGVLRAIGYRPPPPVLQFVDDTVLAVASALAVSLSPQARAERVREARWALDNFIACLRGMLTQPAPPPGPLRRTVTMAARAALVTAPAYAVLGAKYGGEALGIPGDVLEPLVAPLAACLASRIESAIGPFSDREEESGDALEEIAPGRRIAALSGVVLGRLARLRREATPTEDGYAGLELAMLRAYRTAQRHLALDDQLQGRMASAFKAVVHRDADLADLFAEWDEIDEALMRVETHAQRAEREGREAEAERLQREEEDRRKREEAEEASEGGRAVGAHEDKKDDEQQEPPLTRGL